MTAEGGPKHAVDTVRKGDLCWAERVWGAVPGCLCFVCPCVCVHMWASTPNGRKHTVAGFFLPFLSLDHGLQLSFPILFNINTSFLI